MNYNKEREHFNQLSKIEPGLIALEAMVLKCAELSKDIENYDKLEMWCGYGSGKGFFLSEIFDSLIGVTSKFHRDRAVNASNDVECYLRSLLPNCANENCDCCEREQ